MQESPRDAWLSLDEAAARLRVSRLRLREAIAAGALRAQRDNRGLWRVLVEDGYDARDLASVRAAPEQLVETLFDEIEELTGALDERRAENERLGAVAARSQALLERALALAESPGAPADVVRLAALNERSQALVERTLASLEQRDGALQQMTGLMDRALDTVAGLDAEVARGRETAQRQRALLDRVFELARASLDRIAGEAPRGGWFGRLRGRARKD